MALSSISQNAGHSGLREISENTNPINTQKLVNADDRQKRRSQDNMVNVKKKKIEKLKNQKQFAKKGSTLGLYKGQKGKTDDLDENKAPSETFLCSQPSKMSTNK